MMTLQNIQTRIIMNQYKTSDIRREFAAILAEKKFTSVNREGAMTSLVGNTTIEIINASFIADEDAIFGEVNWDYVKREEEWYNSQSLNVNDIPGGPPAVWKAVADPDGFINSNYGFCIYSPFNGLVQQQDHFQIEPIKKIIDHTHGVDSQYTRALNELLVNPESRRAIMIYTRPSMWQDYNRNGRSDFMCTNTVQYLIREGRLHAVVNMRSNDAIFGFRNDRAWQQHVLEKLANDLNVPSGNLYWNVGSLHVYSRHYHCVDPNNYSKV
jgi:thymidylate synthase